jgi:uncharacterized protein YegL
MTEGRGSIEIARPVIAVALLDVSGSMTGGSITALVEALGRWVRDAASGLDARASELDARASEVLLAVVTFGGAHEVKVLSGSRQVDPGAFVPVGTFDTSSISVDDPNGTTPLVDAVKTGLELVAVMKRWLREQQHRQYWRPLVWLVSDGAPTDRDGSTRSPTPELEAFQVELRAWETVHNTIRPHQALGYLTPAEYLASLGIDV